MAKVLSQHLGAGVFTARGVAVTVGAAAGPFTFAAAIRGRFG